MPVLYFQAKKRTTPLTSERDKNIFLAGCWATGERSVDTGHLFRRYAYTGFILSAASVIGQILLDRANQNDSESVSILPFVVSIFFSCGVLRWAITWWNGQNQRNILARIDSDIVVKRVLDKSQAQGESG